MAVFKLEYGKSILDLDRAQALRLFKEAYAVLPNRRGALLPKALQSFATGQLEDAKSKIRAFCSTTSDATPTDLVELRVLAELKPALGLEACTAMP